MLESQVDGATYIAAKKAFALAGCLMVESFIGIKEMGFIKAGIIYDPVLRKALMETRVGLTGGIDKITASCVLLEAWIYEGRFHAFDLTCAAGAVLRSGDF